MECYNKRLKNYKFLIIFSNRPHSLLHRKHHGNLQGKNQGASGGVHNEGESSGMAFVLKEAVAIDCLSF